MEFIFSDPYYDTDNWQEGRYRIELSSQVSQIDTLASVMDTDVGHGADFPSILVEIFQEIDWSGLLKYVAPGGLFLLGERINKNLDAWIEIAGKCKRFIEKMRPARIDERAALLVVLSNLGMKDATTTTDLDVSVQVIPFTTVAWSKRVLDKRPDALYVISVRVPGKVHVVGMKSNMKVEFEKEFSSEWLDF